MTSRLMQFLIIFCAILSCNLNCMNVITCRITPKNNVSWFKVAGNRLILQMIAGEIEIRDTNKA